MGNYWSPSCERVAFSHGHMGATGQRRRPRTMTCVESQAGKPASQPHPRKMPGWANIATEGGGTWDTKQPSSEAAKGLDPKSDANTPPCCLSIRIVDPRVNTASFC